MRPFTLTVSFPGGGPLIGGASTTPYGVHASHAQLPPDGSAEGKPYLPATALRGALREALEAVLRGDGQPACAAGSGGDPDEPDPAGPPAATGSSDPAERADAGRPTVASTATTQAGSADLAAPAVSTAHRICALGSDGEPCLACRMFGTRRPGIRDGERAFSAVVLEDATPNNAVNWTVRSGVAIARDRRSAADQQLVFRRIPEAAGAGPLTFIARGRITEATLAPYLEAAARATTHIGSGRSRGLAQVELSLQWDAARPTPAAMALSATGDVRVRVTLTSPALVGLSIVDDNFRETRKEIPGSTLRGAVGFALRELIKDADHDRPTQDLLDQKRGARFGFLYPAEPAGTTASPAVSAARATVPDRRTNIAADRIAAPLPITAVCCKAEQRDHGVTDTLLDRLVLLHAVSAAEAERAAPRASRCRAQRDGKPCGEPLRTAHGSRLSGDRVATRTVVRALIDRTRQSARDGQLFGQVLLAPGVVLEGTIRGIPPHSRERLAQALGSGILSLGRGRSAGWGHATIEVSPASTLRPVAARAEAFDRALRERLKNAGLPPDRVGRLVPVTLLSPLWPAGSDRGPSDRDNDADDSDDGARELLDAIGPATCLLRARRFTRDGAWDQRAGKMNTFRATAAGGVFVLELASATWHDVVPRLEALERDGIGLRRDQGFGQLLCFDPHFLIGPTNG